MDKNCEECEFFGEKVWNSEYGEHFCNHPTSLLIKENQKKIPDSTNTLWCSNARCEWNESPYGDQGDHKRYCGPGGRYFKNKSMGEMDLLYYLGRK